jgi:mono/diheme cytochrome c family protein
MSGRFNLIADLSPSAGGLVKKTLLAAGVILAGGGAVASQKINDYRVVLPDYQRPATVVRLDQNWTDAQRHEFHHTPQGTRLVPAAWFMALEQPCFSPFGCDLFSDPAYMGRFGFIPSHTDPELNPNGLPVGFAVDKDFSDPTDKRAYPVVGLTCAACHTGELYYDDKVFQIEGAPAMIEVAAFQKALGLAMAFTSTFPMSVGRYGRFEERVLGPNATDAQKAELKQQFDTLLAAARRQADVTSERHIYDNQAGFIRTDALTRIGNQVFAADTNIDANYAVSNAPVRFPQIWNASWFNWVQYNSSIADPLARNVGEALGVRAVVKLYGPDAGRFENSVNMAGLQKLESLLAGPGPLEGLASPKWPAAFPALDQGKVTAGAALYKTHCQQCHLPPLQDVLADLQAIYKEPAHEPQYWWKNAAGNWYIKVSDVELDYVGTDPHQATDFRNRKADSGDLGKGMISASQGLDVVTNGIATAFFEREKIAPADQGKWTSGRDPRDPRVRDDLIYKARPLNGIWAVAPYLHNGSVPTLDALLSPDESARPKTFWMGSKRYDPLKVGYDVAEMKGATLFDTSIAGNSNAGHRFADGPKGKGIIGPALSAEERAQIIEYLKSL